MFNYHFLAPGTLALALALTAGCNGDPFMFPPAPDASANGTGTMVNDSTGTAGAGGTIDGGTFDGAVVTSNDGASGDAAYADSGAGGGDDAAGNAAVRDAGPDGSVPCEIRDLRFGCGTRRSADWIHFASGLDIDLKHGRAWSAPIKVSSFEALRSTCASLVANFVTDFEAPEVDDVRTLAAGCAATLPGGSCEVESGVVLPSESGQCTCSGGVGPNQGKFCRPDVPECETLWTMTECGGVSAECPTPRSWFYDVRTGSLVLAEPTQPLAMQAQARCVAGIDYRVP